MNNLSFKLSVLAIFEITKHVYGVVSHNNKNILKNTIKSSNEMNNDLKYLLYK